MVLTLTRRWFTNRSTVGEIAVDGIVECACLEDVERFGDPPDLDHRLKVDGETAIPCGRYRIVIAPSARFKRDMPRLVDVPLFTGILMHYGNDAGDTHGCLLTGHCDPLRPDWVSASRIAFDRLFAKLQAAHGGIEITIRNVPENV